MLREHGHKEETMNLEEKTKWFWQGKPIEELTNAGADEALRWFKSNGICRREWTSVNENLEVLRNIKDSGRGPVVSNAGFWQGKPIEEMGNEDFLCMARDECHRRHLSIMIAMRARPVMLGDNMMIGCDPGDQHRAAITPIWPNPLISYCDFDGGTKKWSWMSGGRWH
jgi:hypothetical protein